MLGLVLGRTSTAGADRVIEYVRQHGLDRLAAGDPRPRRPSSAAPYLQKQLGGVIAIGGAIRAVQGVFKRIFNLEPGFALDGSQFGRLFADGETFRIRRAGGHRHPRARPHAGRHGLPGGRRRLRRRHAVHAGRGHGAATSGGDARQLYRSIRRLLDLPAATRLYMCHDYPPAGREARWQTTVAEQRQANIHVRDGISEDEFVAMRTRRDATLGMPTLILPAIQVNIRAGHFPPAEDNGVRYLKIPVDSL